MFTDIHTHILHGIDDGPENFEQSVELLNTAIQGGVERIIATPHFYASRHSLNERIELLNQRYNELLEYISKNNLPVSLLSGFEVRYFEGISRIDSLKKLCINNSKFLLLELEYAPITEALVDEILNMSYAGYTVVLAHLERFTKLSGFKTIKQLIAEGEVVAQCNAASLISSAFQRSAMRLLKGGMISLISSDMHSLDLRPPNLNKAYHVIENKFGSSLKSELMQNADKLFTDCTNK